MKISFYIITSIFLICSLNLNAQHTDFKYKKKNHSSDAWFMKSTKESRYISGGIGLELLTYFGDLTPTEKVFMNAIRATRPGVSAFADYRFSNLFGVKGSIFYGRIIGDDYNTSPEEGSVQKYIRNLSMRNDLIGLSINGYVNVLGDPYEYYKRRDYNFFLMTGISVFYSNPKGKVPEGFENAGKWAALRPLGTEGQLHPDFDKIYSTIQVGIPLGFGTKIRLAHRLDLVVEATLHYMLSDYIDDVGGNYVDLGAIEDPLGKAMSDRSQEPIAVIKGEMRDQDIISANTTNYEYTSMYDGNTYTVFQGFGHADAVRGGSRRDIVAATSFKISYIFTK